MDEELEECINDTAYLSSIPGYIENINDRRENEDWEDDEEYNPNEKW